MSQKGNNQISNLQWWQLSLIGVGCIIGTGYFLGSSIAIQIGGPAVVGTFLLAGVGTYIVFMALASMTSAHPEKGSFRDYSKHAFGHWAGFLNGWIYWTSELLIMGSQLTALGLFTTFWFPNAPLWMCSLIYAVLGLLVMFTGVKSFERVENGFAVIKASAILMFILLAGLGLFGVLKGAVAPSVGEDTILSAGLTGVWGSFLYAYYAFGGIEVIGLMAMRLKNIDDAPKAGRLMLILLTFVYVLSIIGALLLVSWKRFSPDESPFVTALKAFDLPYISHLFNGILIIAGFSTMVAALYGVTTMIVTLSEEGDAPRLFSKKGKRDWPLTALTLTSGGLLFSILIALWLPEKVYEYITTAAGLMLLLNWAFILIAYRKLLKPTGWLSIRTWFGIILIAVAISGAWFQANTRPGVFVSIGFIILIGGSWFLFRNKIVSSKRGGSDRGS
ncbi:amino acid permease [Pontibacillus yanchengensis]|uniref:Amino acid permease n=2 Tax=Pontibacillus yanchengensis TaxID=462910 RepID=A0ACC7VDZ6_9BACI|nr:amino acid permease [Pontibacillus yanchengensis]MYL35350.1 amino acid permease [Pontibacillus yanchengensis]MYL52379.1 amino acid permease [Pontibacillus yanchengensis]